VNVRHFSSPRNGFPAPPPDRGRILFVEDVRRELLGGRKSASWVRHSFAPGLKMKIGRDCAWWESEARTWLDGQKEAL
jgi:hypothetical protein